LHRGRETLFSSKAVVRKDFGKTKDPHQAGGCLVFRWCNIEVFGLIPKSLVGKASRNRIENSQLQQRSSLGSGSGRETLL
jgi:hypothetical protein